MNYAIAPAQIHSLAIDKTSERFPVNRIFCVGRNYAEHAREMGSDDREPPFFFMKSASALVDAAEPQASLMYPPATQDLQHEVELVVAICKSGKNIMRADALSHVYGYAIGLDMTRRDLQAVARSKGHPWEFSKSFFNSAPIGKISQAALIGHLQDADISLSVNEKCRQSSNIKMMIWSVAEAIEFLSRHEPLQAGDLIMTGTPAGVGPVVAGDVMHGRIHGLAEIHVRVSAAC